jgi:hypothetical protein
MEELNLLRNTVNILEKLALPYCITGSFASNYYGYPRLTHDLDIIVVMNESDVDGIFKAFSKGGYVDREAIREALEQKDMFNVIYAEVGLKVDFWVCRESSFDLGMFERRKKVEMTEGMRAYIASPEDVILSKLLWAQKTDSEKQIGDAKGVYKVQEEHLDTDYLKSWAAKLNLSSALEQLKKDPPPNTT